MAEIVGRDAELAAVDRFLARPRPAALLIDGEAGIGKTILWREGIRRAETGGLRVLGLDRVTIPVERVHIGGLSLGATGELVRRHTAVSFRRPMLHRIHDTSGGNPLFALGLADALVRIGEKQVGDELPLPGSLREVVHDRIDLLSAESVEALLVAAALSDRLAPRPRAPRMHRDVVADGGGLHGSPPLVSPDYRLCPASCGDRRPILVRNLRGMKRSRRSICAYLGYKRL